jgi:DNA-binding IclR family transcriptional regulator
MLDIIELLANKKNGVSINEISKLTNIPVNSVYRICLELEKRDYLKKDNITGLYRLGIGFYFIGNIVGSRIELRTAALPILEELRNKTNETVHLCIYKNKRMILLEQCETEQNIKLNVETGSVMYPHASAFGKCLLANLSNEEYDDYLQDGLIALTNNTITKRDEFNNQIELIRQTNIAYDFEEYMEGINCIGSGVFDRSGKIAAALGVVAPKYRFMFNSDNAKELVLNAAEKLYRQLGWIKK